MEIHIPPEIQQLLENNATLAISISGGKDSQAMLNGIMAAQAIHHWPGEIYAIHAHLGRMEWKQSLAQCQKMAEEAGIKLVVVQRPQGDLLQQIVDRATKVAGTGRVPFPDSRNRYCTSDQKRTQIDKDLRRHELVVSAEGVRGAESRERAKKPTYGLRQQICTQTRTAYNWRPIFHWTTEEVWESIGTSSRDLERRRLLYATGQHEEAFEGWKAHPAYVMGNERVSCAMCVLGSRNDIINGAKHNPELLKELVAIEKESGFSFQHNFALSSIKI